MRRWLARRERLGLTLRELSVETGVPAGTLGHWAWKLRREGAAGETYASGADSRRAVAQACTRAEALGMKQPIRWTRGEDRGDLGRHYSALLARKEASGLSMRRFAALHDVSACTLYQWKRRLVADRDAQTCEGGRLLAVDVVDEGEARTRKNTYEILFADGTCLRVPRDFDAARVAELVAVVR